MTNLAWRTSRRYGATTFYVRFGLFFLVCNSFHSDLLIAERPTALGYQLRKTAWLPNPIVGGFNGQESFDLSVDDNSGCRELLVGILELHGFQVIAAKCGREAVDLAVAFQPGLILMDLSMPGMNGYEATQAIHAHPRGRKIPVVAVSADCVDYTYVSRALESGFLACVSKPWEEPALLETVTKVLAYGLKPAHALSIVEKRGNRVSRPGAPRLRRAA